MSAASERSPRIGGTSALEQHVQTIMTAILSAGIIASIGFAWSASTTIERVATLQVEQIKTVDRAVKKIDDLDTRLDATEVRMARFESARDGETRKVRQDDDDESDSESTSRARRQ